MDSTDQLLAGLEEVLYAKKAVQSEDMKRRDANGKRARCKYWSNQEKSN